MSDRDSSYIAWAYTGARLFSTCSRRQYMAIIVDVHGRVIGTGYNGSPPGMPHCTDGACPHASDPHGLSSADSHNCIAVHAETNALLYSDYTARRGATLYVNGQPCLDCAKKIAGSGIARVVCTMQGNGDGISFLQAAGLDVEVIVEV